MNYEEMLEAREGAAMHREDIPIGAFYKKLIDKKYRNVVELKPLLTDSIVFCEALKSDCRMTSSLQSKNQLHFSTKEDSGGVYELELEQGNYQTLEQLLQQNPAVVAGKGFIEDVVKQLAELTQKLNADGVYQLCYAPQSIFVRKGDNQPMLLTHGSYYLGMQNQKELYDGFSHFVAPEVLEEGHGDERSDVYGLARLMEYLYSDASLPVEYKGVVSKATDANPDKRYHNVDSMLSAMQQKRSLLRSAATLAAAVLVALLCFWVYFELVPQAEDIEFVEPRGEEEFDDLLDKGFNAATELGLMVTDSAGNRLSEEEIRSMEEYQAKAEQIFRKRYAEEAERILSKIYNNEHMNATEKTFAATSTETTKELVKMQSELGQEAGLSDAKSQMIAAEIIDKISERKKRELGGSNKYGAQMGGNDDE